MTIAAATALAIENTAIPMPTRKRLKATGVGSPNRRNRNAAATMMPNAKRAARVAQRAADGSLSGMASMDRTSKALSGGGTR